MSANWLVYHTYALFNWAIVQTGSTIFVFTATNVALGISTGSQVIKYIACSIIADAEKEDRQHRSELHVPDSGRKDDSWIPTPYTIEFNTGSNKYSQGQIG